MSYNEPLTEREIEKRRAQKTHQQNIDEALLALTSVKNGRDFLYWLLEECRVGQQPFAGDALKTAFACGELNVGNKLLARITRVAPDGYITMLKEQTNDRSSNNTNTAGADSDSGTDSDND